MTLSAFGLVAIATAQAPLWTQVEGVPTTRLRDGSAGVFLRWDLGARTPRTSNLTTQLLSKTYANAADGIYDATPDGSKIAFVRLMDNGDGTQSYYVDVVGADKRTLLSALVLYVSPEMPSYGPERVFFSPDGNYLVLQYYADEEGNAYPQAVYYRISDGSHQTVLGRLLPFSDGVSGLLTNQDGTCSRVEMAAGAVSALPFALPPDFHAKETRGDWVLGQTSGGWAAVRRSDGFLRSIPVDSSEGVLGIALSDTTVIIAKPSTGDVRGLTLAEGYHLELPDGPPGPMTLSPDRSRFVQPLINGRRTLVRITNRNDKVYTDERAWLAGFDDSSRVWMLGSNEWRIRDDAGGLPERYYVPDRPGTVAYTDGVVAVDRVMESGKEVYYKLTLFNGRRKKWFEVTPKVGAVLRFNGLVSAYRSYFDGTNYVTTTYDGAGNPYNPVFPYGSDYLAVQNFAPDGKLFGVATQATDSNLPGPTQFVFYNAKTAKVVRRVDIGVARPVVQATMSADGTLAAVPTQTDLRLVDLISGTARSLTGNAAKSWQKSLDAGAGQPVVALSGNGDILFLSSGVVGGFYRISDGKMLASAPTDATAVLSMDGRRGLVSSQGTKSLFAIPDSP
ncbi:hypothetical protein BH11ARM2_BH11ARM2_31380 [soil metagenome]